MAHVPCSSLGYKYLDLLGGDNDDVDDNSNNNTSNTNEVHENTSVVDRTQVLGIFRLVGFSMSHRQRQGQSRMLLN